VAFLFDCSVAALTFVRRLFLHDALLVLRDTTKELTDHEN
jgi:hypothetical protein